MRLIPFLSESAFDFRFVQDLHKSFFNICIKWLLMHFFQIGVFLESSFQWVDLTEGRAIVVWKIGLWFTPKHHYFIPLACKRCRALYELLSLLPFLWLTYNIYFWSISFYVPLCLDIFCHFHIFCGGEITNIFLPVMGPLTNHPNSVKTAKSSWISWASCLSMMPTSIRLNVLLVGTFRCLKLFISSL